MSKMNNDVWKFAASHMATILIGLGAAYFTMGQNAVSREEAMSMVQTQSPYVQDRLLIKESLIKINNKIDIISEKIEELKVEQSRSKALIETLVRSRNEN